MAKDKTSVMAKDKTSVMMDNDAHKVLTIIKATIDSCKTISDAVMYLRDNQKATKK